MKRFLTLTVNVKKNWKIFFQLSTYIWTVPLATKAGQESIWIRIWISFWSVPWWNITWYQDWLDCGQKGSPHYAHCGNNDPIFVMKILKSGSRVSPALIEVSISDFAAENFYVQMRYSPVFCHSFLICGSRCILSRVVKKFLVVIWFCTGGVGTLGVVADLFLLLDVIIASSGARGVKVVVNVELLFSGIR